MPNARGCTVESGPVPRDGDVSAKDRPGKSPLAEVTAGSCADVPRAVAVVEVHLVPGSDRPRGWAESVPESCDDEVGMPPFPVSHSDPKTAVALCACDFEYRAVHRCLQELEHREHAAGTGFQIGRLPASRWTVVAAVIGEGNVGAAIIAERAVSMFRPDLLLFVGVAGALTNEVTLGDVFVVVTRVEAAPRPIRPASRPAPGRLAAKVELLEGGQLALALQA